MTELQTFPDTAHLATGVKPWPDIAKYQHPGVIAHEVKLGLDHKAALQLFEDVKRMMYVSR